MFIERSAGRIRLARTVFVLAGLVPCVALVALASWRHSPSHVESLERDGTALLGLPVEIGAVDHPRPGTVRLDKVRLRGPSGDEILAISSLDVEVSAVECRLTADRLTCTPRAAAQLAALAQGWLEQPARFGRDLVVDVREVEWQVADVAVGRPTGLHAECVAAGGSRAVRVRREPAGTDEIRVQSSVSPTPALDVAGVIEEPLPAAIVAALAGLPDIAGAEALVRGRVDAECSDGRWSGEVAGVLERLDLAACGARAEHRLRGEAAVEISRLKLSGGRIEACDLGLTATQGRVGQDFLDALVRQFGCRPGPAYRSLAGDAMREFDRFSCRVGIDRDGVRVRAFPDTATGILSSHGLVVLDEPAQPVPVERLAWFCSPPGGVAVPASAASAWLISKLPLGSGGGF
jgi:hypothetical protein